MYLMFPCKFLTTIERKPNELVSKYNCSWTSPQATTRTQHRQMQTTFIPGFWPRPYLCQSILKRKQTETCETIWTPEWDIGSHTLWGTRPRSCVPSTLHFCQHTDTSDKADITWTRQTALDLLRTVLNNGNMMVFYHLFKPKVPDCLTDPYVHKT
jgi:hypothetical protein